MAAPEAVLLRAAAVAEWRKEMGERVTRSFYDPLLQELYEAGLQLRPFLKASTDRSPPPKSASDAMTALQTEFEMPQVEWLRRHAAEIEARDAAITRFRAALDAVGGDKP